MNSYAKTLTIAGSDSGGGAGIQADLKTFSALECYGMSVLTALTAQNTVGVRDIHPVPKHFIAEQMEAIYDDIGTDAVKIGMLHAPDVIGVIAAELRQNKVSNVVLDPVMIAKSGDKLLKEEAIAALRDTMLPFASIITPNIPEAEELLETKVEYEEDLYEAGQLLTEMGPKAVLLKGGHWAGTESNDLLFLRGNDEVQEFKAKRVDTQNTHGTGCTLSSAIAAFLAKGHGIPESVSLAKNYLTEALNAGKSYELGQGHGPLHHFYKMWNHEDR